MFPDNIELISRVLKEYYELGLTQAEIGYREHLSKSTVSRILQKAKQEKLVTFQLNLPFKSLYDLEEEFKSRFHLRTVRIVPTRLNEISVRYLDVAQSLAFHLNELIEDGDIIGVSWGNAMETLSENLRPCSPMKHNLKIVQIAGSLAKNLLSSKSYRILENFSNNYLSISYMLPAPAIVDNIQLAELFITDSQIKEVLDIAEKARIAIFGIGFLAAQSVIFESETLRQPHFELLSKDGAICDVLFHFLNIEGNIVNKDIDAKTIGLPLDKLKNKEHRIALAVGEHKARSIIGALNSGAINTLFTDEITAKKVMDEYSRLF